MKQYIQPAIRVKNITLESQMMSDSDTDSINYSKGGTYDMGNGTNLGHGRRGTYGDLWFDGDED